MSKEGAPVEGVEVDFRPGLVAGPPAAFTSTPIVGDFRDSLACAFSRRRDFPGREGPALGSRADFVDDLNQRPPVFGRFAFRGPIDLTWNGRLKRLDFSSPKIESVLGALRATGRLEIGREVEVVLNGAISDVRQAREFTAPISRHPLRFPEIRGRVDG
ncbi:MAG: hypothetical protein MZV65_29150 [Chromatiales bacterium]|nr:hypothetical protein [Chromatiales bacterium]